MDCLQKGVNVVLPKSSLIIRHQNAISLQKPFSSRQPSCRRGNTSPRISAIGFDLTGSSPFEKSPDRSADELSRAAASLLLYQSVLKSKPAQAYMNILLHLQKGSPLKLMEQYGELYKALANEGFSSWKEFIVDQILRGYDNPFAKAASRGDPRSHLIPAARHDLNILHSLAVSDATLAEWVDETVSTLPESWIAAATSLVPPSANPIANLDDLIPREAPSHVLAPLTKDQRAALRLQISQQSDWSDAVVLLERYHAAYDYGLFSAHKVLKWTGDRLQAHDVSFEGIEVIDEDNDRSKGEVLNFVLSLSLEHSFLNRDVQTKGLKPTKDMRSMIVKSINVAETHRNAIFAANHLAGLAKMGEVELGQKQIDAANSLRIVLLPQVHHTDVAELAWTLSQHPRTRIVVVTTTDKKIDQDLLNILLDGGSWPSNAFMMLCSPEEPN